MLPKILVRTITLAAGTGMLANALPQGTSRPCSGKQVSSTTTSRPGPTYPSHQTALNSTSTLPVSTFPSSNTLTDLTGNVPNYPSYEAATGLAGTFSMSTSPSYGLVTDSTSTPSASSTGFAPATTCAPVSGDFNITNFRYYPENADWDSRRCVLYGSANPNGTMLVYDPYTQEQSIIRFPGISDNPPVDLHISGIEYDPWTDRVFISAGAAATWISSGTNVTRPDYLIKWNPETRKEEWRADFSEFAAGIEKDTGVKIGGFQDQAVDDVGNAYCVAAFGNVIAKLNNETGEIQPWWITPKEEMNATSYGMLGIVSITEGTRLILSDAVAKRFVTFDLFAGPSNNKPPTEVQMSGIPNGYDIYCDGLYAPPMYDNRILLCSDTRFGSEGNAGAIVVYGTKDDWKTGQHLGAVLNNDDPLANGSAPCATVQISNSIYISEEWFFDSDPTAPAGYGNRTEFPMIDITSKVKALAKPFLEKSEI